MNKHHKILKLAAFFLTMAITILFSCDDKELSSEYDIAWPLPVITNFTPEAATIGAEITITGDNLEKTSAVSIGTSALEIVSVSKTQLVVKLPRTVNSDYIKITTLYAKEVVSIAKFVPEYPKAKVIEWPSKIVRGESFKIKGENVDLINSMKIGATDVAVDGSKGQPGEISIPTAGITLSESTVVLTVKSAKGGLDGSTTSPAIPVEDAGATFEPVAAAQVFSFETADGTVTFDDKGQGATAGLNAGSSGVTKARGQNYYTVKKSGAANWQYLGELKNDADIDLTDFHDPHLTFYFNTNGKDGYFQLELMQGGNKWGRHFKSGDGELFDYKFKPSTGWNFVSVPLNVASMENWGGGASPFDPNGVLEYVLLGFSTGNGAGDVETNIDQVMITDGPVKVSQVLFSFEDGSNPYSGSANASVSSGGGVSSIIGNKFLSVTKGSVNKFEWTGDACACQAVDISSLSRPFISFWVNTGNNYGNIQIEITQNGTKWGSDPFKAESNDLGGYSVKTNGEWKLYTFELTKLMTSNWGGSGTAFEPGVAVDYVKVGFSSGNQETGTYEVNIDQLMISDGPVF